MLSKSVLRRVALKAGISQQKIIKMYNAAIDEAASLGKENDDKFILEVLEMYAGLNEEDISQTLEDLYTKFLESEFTNFDKFLENEWNKKDEEIVSTNFGPDVRPEHPLGHSVKMPPDEEEDEKKESINKLPGTLDKNGKPIPADRNDIYSYLVQTNSPLLNNEKK